MSERPDYFTRYVYTNTKNQIKDKIYVVSKIEHIVTTVPNVRNRSSSVITVIVPV